jgi:hypothetical protein
MIFTSWERYLNPLYQKIIRTCQGIRYPDVRLLLSTSNKGDV